MTFGVTETDFVDASTVSIKQQRAIRKWLPNNASNVSIYRSRGENADSPITVSFKINGAEIIKRVRITSDFSVIEISEQKVTDLDKAKNEFDNVLVSLQEQNQQLNQTLGKPLLTEEAKAIQEQLNAVTNTLAIMTTLSSELDKKEKMNTDKVLSLIRKLDKQTALIALTYYKATQLKC